MKFSICADIMYGKMPFSEKLKKIREMGFHTFEFWRWGTKDTEKIKETMDECGMDLSTFCLDSPDENIMKRIGRHMLNSDCRELLAEITVQSLEVAKKLGAKSLIATVGDSVCGVPYEVQISRVYESLEGVKGLFEEAGVTLLIEPINRKERKEYLLPDVRECAKIVKNINSPNIKLLFDLYHQHMENAFCLSDMPDLIPLTGHIHIADIPGRHEPGCGTVDFDGIFRTLSECGYNGFIGAEFIPSVSEDDALARLAELGEKYSVLP